MRRTAIFGAVIASARTPWQADGHHVSGFAAVTSVLARYARRPAKPGPGPARPAQPSPATGRRAHTGYMGRIIGTILGAILAIWLAVTAAGAIFATFKMFLIVALIAMAVFVVVWLVARRPRRD